MTPSPSRLFTLYYAATVVFAVLDWLFGANLRVAFLDDLPAWRIAYYLACGVCFLVIWRFPQWAVPVAALESLINVVGLILETGLRVMVPSVAMIEQGDGLFTVQELINFLLSGAVGYAAWSYRSRALRAFF